MDDNLRNEIRALVQEEMSSSPRQNLPTRTNIMARTRELIRQNTMQSSNSLNSLTNSPNHSPRLIDRGKKRKMQDRPTTFELTVLGRYDSNIEEYTFSSNTSIMKQVMLDLNASMVESEIREAICKAMHPKIRVSPSEFIFVKRERNKIIIPQHDSDFVFNFAQIKKLVGQGKLYIQLKRCCLIYDESDSSDDEKLPTFQMKQSEAPCSSREATLTELFPDLDNKHIKDILDTTVTLEEAADAAASVSERADRDVILKPGGKTVDSMYDAFDILSKKMKLERKPMKVYEESVITDVLSFYKDHNFDPTFKWRVTFQNQAGADAGGLSRELFHLFFKKLCDSKDLRLFEGKRFKLLPTCRTDTCISNIFKHIGVMMAHCLCQGVRPLILSEVAYRYIIYGDIQEAVSYVNIEDIATESISFYVKEIMEADTKKLEILAEDKELQQLIQETGEFIYLTEKTKEQVIQSILIHDALVKRKPSYDLLREGLRTNGVLDLMQAHPEVCKHFLVYTEELDGITPSNFMRDVSFVEATPEQEEVFEATIRQFSKEELSKLLHFVTGSEDLTALKSDKITVKFNTSHMVFASSCLFELSVPSMSSTKALRDVLLHTMDGNDFNTV